MNMTILAIYAVSWIGMVILAILNGAAREKIYGPLMREFSAHQLSTFIGLILLGFYMWILTGIYRIQSSSQALAVGSMWFIMTVLFEFIFGHFIMRHPFSKLFHDYNLLKGRVWLLVPIWTAIAPYVFYRCRP
jgi:hypothetical protein